MKLLEYIGFLEIQRLLFNRIKDHAHFWSNCMSFLDVNRLCFMCEVIFWGTCSCNLMQYNFCFQVFATDTFFFRFTV